MKTPGAQRSDGKPSLLVLLLLGVAPMLLALLRPMPMLTAFEDAAYDARMRLRNRVDPRPISDTIRVVGVSDADEQRLDQDLSSRQAYMELVRRLRAWGAAGLVFDVFFVGELPSDDLFAEVLRSASLPAVLAYHFRYAATDPLPLGDPPEDLAPVAEMAKSGGDAEHLRSVARDLQDYIGELKATQLRQARDGDAGRGETLRALAWARQLRNDLLKRWMVLRFGVEPADTAGEPYEGWDLRLLSMPVMTSGAQMGFANVEKGEEEVVRRAPLVYTFRGRAFPHLSLAAAMQYYGVEWKDVAVEWGRHIRFTPARNGEGEVRIPIDGRGRYLVNYREGESFLNRHPTLSAVLLAEAPTEVLPADRAGYFGGRIVLVGEVISGGLATDVEPIPLQPKFPMVGMHANILDNILRRDFLRVPPWWVTALLAAGFGAASSLLFYRFGFLRATVLAGGLAAAALLGNFWLFQHHAVVFPVVRFFAGLTLSVLLFFGYLVAVKDRDRRLVRDVFLKSVSPKIGEEILRNFHDPSIWGARREITVLFLDVRGYTTLSEEQSPEVVLDLLDRFYDTASEAVFRHEGQVNKFLGDAVLALFGALASEPPNHAERALRAAAEIQARILEINDSAEFRAIGAPPIRCGAGVNTGESTVGLVGRRRIRIEYTALGDAVNVASRLQGIAGSGEIMLSGTAMAALGAGGPALVESLGLLHSPAEDVPLKGKKLPIAAYRLKVPAAANSSSAAAHEMIPGEDDT